MLELLKKIQDDVNYLIKLQPGTPWSENDHHATVSFQAKIKQVENYVLYGITPEAQRNCIQDRDDHNCIYDAKNCVMFDHNKVAPDHFGYLKFDELEVKQLLHEIITESKLAPDQIVYEACSERPDYTFTNFSLIGLRQGGFLKIKVMGETFLKQKLYPLINR